MKYEIELIEVMIDHLDYVKNDMMHSDRGYLGNASNESLQKVVSLLNELLGRL